MSKLEEPDMKEKIKEDRSMDIDSFLFFRDSTSKCVHMSAPTSQAHLPLIPQFLSIPLTISSSTLATLSVAQPSKSASCVKTTTKALHTVRNILSAKMTNSIDVINSICKHVVSMADKEIRH